MEKLGQLLLSILSFVVSMRLIYVIYFQRYLKRFEYANANTEDLWAVLGEVSKQLLFSLVEFK